MKTTDTTATIVMFHIVRPAGGFAARLNGPDLDGFRYQLDHIRAHYSPVALLDLADAAEHGHLLPPRPIVLTFDDGYAVHHEIVLPALRERAMTATFFPVATSMLDGRLLDVNQIQLLLADLRNVDAIVAAIDEAVDDRRGPSRDEYRSQYWKASRWDPPQIVYVKRMLQHALPESLRRALIDDLFRRLVSADARAVAAELYMSVDDANAMLDAGMTIGTHGGRHLRLSTLTREEQTVELDDALRVLDAIGKPRQAFAHAYANGDYDAASIEILRARGCRAAVTTKPEPARITTTELLTLPRIDTNDLPTRA